MHFWASIFSPKARRVGQDVFPLWRCYLQNWKPYIHHNGFSKHFVSWKVSKLWLYDTEQDKFSSREQLYGHNKHRELVEHNTAAGGQLEEHITATGGLLVVHNTAAGGQLVEHNTASGGQLVEHNIAAGGQLVEHNTAAGRQLVVHNTVADRQLAYSS